MLPGKQITVPEILVIARRRLPLLVIPPVLTFFVALVYSSTLPDKYQSDMLIRVDPQRVPDAFVRSTVTQTASQRLDAIRVQVLSRTTLEELIKELDLYAAERQRLPLEDVVEKMRSNISVVLERPQAVRGDNSSPNAFHVLFTYPNAEVAAVVTQRLGSRFVDQNGLDRAGLASATSRFLQAQLADSRKELEKQERRLEDFRQRHGKELPTQLQTNMQAITTAQLRVQSLVESIARDSDRQQMLERLHREAADAPARIEASARLPSQTPTATATGSIEEQLVAARANLATLELRYTPDHPDVARARRTVRELEGKVAAGASGGPAETAGAPPALRASSVDPERRERLSQMMAEIESLGRQIAFKEAEEAKVRSEIAEYQRRIESVPGLESEWVAITRDYDTQQLAYRDLLAKSEAAKVSVDLEEREIGERFRIVDPAAIPVNPLPSIRVQINLAGLALGLFIGVGLAFLLEYRDASFRTVDDVLEVLALPVLVAVPHVVSGVEKARRRRRRYALSLACAVCAFGLGYLTWSLRLWKSLV